MQDDPDSGPYWNLWWKTVRFTASQLATCHYPYQRVNHFPKSSDMTRKDALLRNLRRMKARPARLMAECPLLAHRFPARCFFSCPMTVTMEFGEGLRMSTQYQDRASVSGFLTLHKLFWFTF